MPKPVYDYDDECEVLALHFLGPRSDPKDISDLAQVLQDAVELWFVGQAPEITMSIYAQLPADCEPGPEHVLNDAGPVGDDTPISGEPK